MNKQNVTKFCKEITASMKKHSPEILTGVGIAGMITTTVLAVKATPKALKLIDEVKHEEHKDELTPIETVKAAWKPYVPAVITGAASVTCLIGASSVNAKRNAALMSAYQLSTATLNTYREKVIETIGEKKEKVIQDNLAKEQVDKNPLSQNTVIMTQKGTTLFYDPPSGRYFNSDIDKIKRAINELNYRMTGGMEMYVSLNDFYDAIDIPRIDLGNVMGWSVGKGGMIDIRFGAILAEDETPCIVLEYLVPPDYGFDNLY